MSRADVRILIIDDVNAMRLQIANLLSEAGFTSITMAEDAMSAVNHVKTQTYHLVLCDLHMAGLDGIDVIRYLQTSGNLQNAAVVMISANATKERVLQAVSIGVDGYIVKPFTKAHIETKLISVLTKKQVPL